MVVRRRGMRRRWMRAYSTAVGVVEEYQRQRGPRRVMDGAVGKRAQLAGRRACRSRLFGHSLARRSTFQNAQLSLEAFEKQCGTQPHALQHAPALPSAPSLPCNCHLHATKRKGEGESRSLSIHEHALAALCHSSPTHAPRSCSPAASPFCLPQPLFHAAVLLRGQLHVWAGLTTALRGMQLAAVPCNSPTNSPVRGPLS
jgi:hypothetical protein